MTAIEFPRKIYDIVVVGAGSAAAMYLNTLRKFHSISQSGPSFKEQIADPMPTSILVIGMHDPWAGARGYDKNRYIENINQSKQLFEHGTGATASMNQNPVDRKQWAEENEAIILEVTQGNFLQDEVRSISKRRVADLERSVFVISTATGEYAGSKIILATGAGIETNERQYHQVPDEVITYKRQYPDCQRVMDLDQFQTGQEGCKSGQGKSVAVIGENAGTDAVMEASTRGYATRDVHWVLANGRKPGTALTWDISALNHSFTAETAGKERAGGGCVDRFSGRLTLEQVGNKIRVIRSGAPPLLVDYFVYAKGQSGGGIQRADEQTGILSSLVTDDIKNNLEPIYDVNQRLGNSAYEHVVGLQLKDTTKTYGIEVVGSAAFQAGRTVTHTYLDKEYLSLWQCLNNNSMVFHNTASLSKFEHLKQRKFVDIVCMRDDEQQLKGEQYVQQVKDFSKQSATRINSGVADVEQFVNKNERLAKELVYMHKLRNSAKRYYEEIDDRAARGTPSSPSALLSSGLKQSLPQTINDNRLLGGMQRNVAAVNSSYNTEHISTRYGNNYLGDKQSLALYVVVHYPDISQEEANRFVEEVIQERTTQDRGFTPERMGQLDSRLEAMNRVSKTPSRTMDLSGHYYLSCSV